MRCHSSCAECFGPTDNECSKCQADHVFLNGRCVTCANIDKSLHQHFDFTGGSCKEKCGKGLRITNDIQCDDGNSADGDGCSKDCQIEEGFTCSGGNEKSKDYCIDVTPLTFAIKQTLTDEYSFEVTFSKELSEESLKTLNDTLSI